MRRLPREAPAGTRWHYSTGETNLVGVLLGAATKKPLATYLSEKIWVPAGMEQQATWLLSRTGQEISGCCIQAAHARLRALRALHPERRARRRPKHRARRLAGRGHHRAHATSAGPAAATATSGGPTTTARFAARGIFGQGIFIDPKRKLVIASNADWAGGATDRVASDAREAFYRAVQKAIDDEAAGVPASGPRR